MTKKSLTTCVCKVAYPHLDEPWAYEDYDKPKYSLMVIIPKTEEETIKALKKILYAAAVDRFGDVKPAELATGKIQHPLTDGDEAIDKSFADEVQGAFYFNARANADRPPSVVDAQHQNIETVDSGDFCRVNVSAWAWGEEGGQIGRGVSLTLRGVLLVRSGNGFTDNSTPSPKEMFGAPESAQADDAPAPAKAPAQDKPPAAEADTFDDDIPF